MEATNGQKLRWVRKRLHLDALRRAGGDFWRSSMKLTVDWYRTYFNIEGWCPPNQQDDFFGLLCPTVLQRSLSQLIVAYCWAFPCLMHLDDAVEVINIHLKQRTPTRVTEEGCHDEKGKIPTAGTGRCRLLSIIDLISLKHWLNGTRVARCCTQFPQCLFQTLLLGDLFYTCSHFRSSLQTPFEFISQLEQQ